MRESGNNMYNSPMVLRTSFAAGGLVVLPRTGLDVIWLLLAACALVGAGMALVRIAPRSQA